MKIDNYTVTVTLPSLTYLVKCYLYFIVAFVHLETQDARPWLAREFCKAEGVFGAGVSAAASGEIRISTTYEVATKFNLPCPYLCL